MSGIVSEGSMCLKGCANRIDGKCKKGHLSNWLKKENAEDWRGSDNFNPLWIEACADYGVIA